MIISRGVVNWKSQEIDSEFQQATLKGHLKNR
jgi:hypothetical protein